MEDLVWKARIVSVRAHEQMKFLRAYLGRKATGEPSKGLSMADVLRLAVQVMYDAVLRDLERDSKEAAIARDKAAWWLKMAKEGRNGDPFPGAAYPPPEHVRERVLEGWVEEDTAL